MSAPRITEARRERDQVAIRRALISVSDKTGLEQLAKALGEAGVEIVSTGSTAQKIKDTGVDVVEAAEVTGFPEILDGRVKTLHPKVHGGLLADLRLASHEQQLEELEIRPFDLVVVNLYPFAETVASGAEAEDVVEQIDIGGPAMVRASAKNHANVAIVVSPERYAEIIDAAKNGGTSFQQRRELAAAAFAHTAEYDANVSSWFAEQLAEAGDDDAEPAAEAPAEVEFPEALEIAAEREATLRYGENSHQQAALYRVEDGRGIAQAVQLHGKEMSYNNYVDADAALRAAYDFGEPAVAIIKHANPCGIAVAPEGLEEAEAIAEAHRRAHACDPLSAFGGVVAANREVSLEMAQTLSEIFTEVVVAPGFADEAAALLARKKNIRLLAVPADYARADIELRQISGGFLAQTVDRFPAEGRISDAWELAVGEPVDDATMRDLEFAWKACRAVKSNAILLANEGASVGVGMGQVNRVDSCHLAVDRAGDRAAGSVAASDAFFPFADGLEVLTAADVRAVVQPGGSIRDDEVRAAAEKAGIAMYFTGERHFFH
ncbi:bifunctional phosphoribosylaminoimidazolecarboxamide formyltransferase/IMP cyclohydrolase [Gulosibacter sp. 10]|uniref:bifunctional phosphoribosylaminoimidazolecarboxamide formyltransferase/IMP cyclohydrolase n=1 Tax=Gulosibacter sp. 10 TaxID=1255570 RepID=UPI00097E8ED4|nr:bifunctional phosphoribosylaminoimidazolecarboxamide formyltransferase/IMP cyclohydrolase [Gulosibacter sp. 10]SJM71474.1 IMP cyclohydrolase / Phosphoribosylaminoimidazolecarboxamide formyltransferase [Gulosibacter sp. 10]